MQRRKAEPQRGERLKIETGCEGTLFNNDHAAPQTGTNRADPLSGMLEKALFHRSAQMSPMIPSNL